MYFASTFARFTKHITIRRNSLVLKKFLFQFRSTNLPILSWNKRQQYSGWARLVSWLVVVSELSRVSFGTNVLFFSEIVNCVHSTRGDCVGWKYQRNHSTEIIRKLGHRSAIRTRRESNLKRFYKLFTTKRIEAISLWSLCLSARKISIYY